MDIRHLQHVLLLAEELNFSRAAERAHLTQSAFSRSIQTAETQAGVKFFDRTQRSVKPTAVGKRIIERGRSILSEARDLDREIRFLESGHACQLSIGAGTTIAASILPGVTTRGVSPVNGVSCGLPRVHQARRRKLSFSPWLCRLSQTARERTLGIHHLAQLARRASKPAYATA